MKYKVTKEGKEKFQSNLIRLTEQNLRDTHNAGGTETVDKILRTRAKKEQDLKIGRGILRNTGGSLQKFIRNFTGHKDGTDTQNCSLVVGQTHDNAENVEYAKMQVSQDKRPRRTTMSPQSTIPRN